MTFNDCYAVLFGIRLLYVNCGDRKKCLNTKLQLVLIGNEAQKEQIRNIQFVLKNIIYLGDHGFCCAQVQKQGRTKRRIMHFT